MQNGTEQNRDTFDTKLDTLYNQVNVEHYGASMSKLYIEALKCYKAMVYHWSTVRSKCQVTGTTRFVSLLSTKRELSQLQRMRGLP